MHQGALTGTRRAHDGSEVAELEVHSDIVEGPYLTVVFAVNL